MKQIIDRCGLCADEKTELLNILTDKEGWGSWNGGPEFDTVYEVAGKLYLRIVVLEHLRDINRAAAEKAQLRLYRVEEKLQAVTMERDRLKKTKP